MPAKKPYDKDSSFQVKLARPIRQGGVMLSHVPDYTMDGDRLNAIVAEHGQDAIATAAPIEEAAGDGGN